jgi:hypothetical protein
MLHIFFAGSTSDDRNIFLPLLLKNLKSLDGYFLLFTFAALFNDILNFFSRDQEVTEATSRSHRNNFKRLPK